jgi:hypothetical protein
MRSGPGSGTRLLWALALLEAGCQAGGGGAGGDADGNLVLPSC